MNENKNSKCGHSKIIFKIRLKSVIIAKQNTAKSDNISQYVFAMNKAKFHVR